MTRRSRLSELFSAPTPVLIDGWYGWVTPPGGEHPWTVFTTALEALPAPLARRILAHGALRGIALALLSTRYPVVAVNRFDPGWRSLLLTRALLGRRPKLVVFQFFDHPPAPGIGPALWARVERWALRRALALAQVLTTAELNAYPRLYDLPRGRFTLLRFPARIAPEGSPPPRPRAEGPILAAGRAHCDWETLFAAAAGRGWDLQVVAGADDAERVRALEAVHRTGAQISIELLPEMAAALLAEASISLICVTDGLVGRGHIRLAEATSAGAAVIASDVSSLQGYLDDAGSTVRVPPGDPEALRAAVESLAGDARRRRLMALRAFALGARWTAADYLRELQSLCAEVADSASGA